jgi:hypothetical protein
MMAAEQYVLDTDLRERHGEEARKTVLAYTWEREVASLVRVLTSLS